MPQHKVSGGWGKTFPLFFICSLYFMLFALPAQVFATADKQANNISFDAQAVLPDNQQSDASYYDLKVQPGTTQDLILKLRNTSTDQVKVIVEGNNAATNQNGAIDYSDPDAKLLGGPTFKELISGPQTIVLKPEEERDVHFQLKIPAEGFDGTFLGGFYCYEDAKEQEKSSEGFSLKNKFAYTIGVKLNCSDKEIQPEIALKKVKPGLDNGYLTVFADLENLQPVLMSKVDMHATVTKKGEKDVLKVLDKKISFAPRTKFCMPISWDNEPLKKGKYELTIHVKNDAGKKWLFRKDFEIKGTDEKLNKQAVEVTEEQKHNAPFILISLVFLGIILGLIAYIYKLKRNK